MKAGTVQSRNPIIENMVGFTVSGAGTTLKFENNYKANYNIGQTPKTTVAMDSNTHKYEITIDYTAADVGKTFYYVVKEKNAGKTIDGITYSNTEYKVTVTVTDGGNGAVDATATVAGGAINALNFTNDYDSASTVIDFEGSKNLNLISGNRELKANDFTFDLYKANENFEIDGAAIHSVNNDEKGDFAFVDVPLDAAGTHYFIIKENSQNPIGGVIYDNTQYRITVTVADNGKGQLVVTGTAMVKVKGDSSEAAEVIEFINDYSVTSTNVNIVGSKKLNGRDLNEGEFKFVMIEMISCPSLSTINADPATSVASRNGTMTGMNW